MKDIIIVGGGSIGIACALECEKRQWDYLVLEKRTINRFKHPNP